MSRSRRPQHVLLVFLDGVGIGAKDPRRNPFFSAPLPFLSGALEGRFPSLKNRRIDATEAICVPLDATMGVRGLPQSGTGQAALYTGINAAKSIGQHFGPYLYSTLKPLVAEHNFFQTLLAAHRYGYAIALANAFPQHFFEYMERGGRRIVAGVFAAMSAGVRFRDIDDLKRGEGISTDLTAVRWKEIGHPDAPVVSAYDAGMNLARIASGHHFTLYEYFLTDKAGHECSHEFAHQVLKDVDDFLRGAFDRLPSDALMIVTSDHGNLEELSTKSHTRNPVPAFLFGRGKSNAVHHLHSITDVAPFIVSALNNS